jgi:hypothetical protein
MTARDIVAIILSVSILLHPLITVVMRAVFDAGVSGPAAEALQAIVVATLAVVAGYLAGPDRRPPGANGR